MIHAYIGDGKGKTTAATGLAVRYAGCGKKVEIVQFLKDGTSSECKLLKNVFINITSFMKPDSKFFWEMNEEEKCVLKEEMQQAFRYAEKLAGNDIDMIVLDEVCGAVENGLVDRYELIEFLKTYGTEKEIVITGRKVCDEIIELSDYVSEIKKIKHPFDKGMDAKKGIEY